HISARTPEQVRRAALPGRSAPCGTANLTIQSHNVDLGESSVIEHYRQDYLLISEVPLATWGKVSGSVVGPTARRLPPTAVTRARPGRQETLLRVDDDAPAP